MAFVIFAEDDETLRDGIAVALESAGYEAQACADGAEALAAVGRRRPDLLLLDIMMPRKSGFDVCAEVRRTDPALPIIFLTAKADETDQVLGLGLGADDFIAKPFRVKVLLARVAAALRRAAVSSGPAAGESFRVGRAIVDARRFSLDPCDGTPVQTLSVRELGLLRAFAAHPGEVLSRDRLLDDVWGVDYSGGPRTLDQHVLQVRKKLGSSADAIETVHRAGYRLRSACLGDLTRP
ncbi:MAG: response regulator transcription factor [Kiritimatiellae bacterium]|nr:response regulator transcription factor [Kiritimatiellia bacterium]